MLRLTIVLTVIVIFSGCSGCSKSGRRQVVANNAKKETSFDEGLRKNSGDKTIVKMVKVNGVYEIPTEINGIPMHFIFDTGAGLISISETEAIFLYKQGTLTQDDVLRKANFTDANGGISEGTIINLKTVKLGDKTLKNVEASVVHNLEAPLLMGQSALENFGKISIDYGSGTITFE